MIQGAKQVLEDVLHDNDTMMKTQEIKENLQRQEEAFRENKKLGNHEKNQKN